MHEISKSALLMSLVLAVSLGLSTPSLAQKCDGRWTVPRDMSLVLSGVQSAGLDRIGETWANGKKIGFTLRQTDNKFEGGAAAGLSFAKVTGRFQVCGIPQIGKPKPLNCFNIQTVGWTTPAVPITFSGRVNAAEKLEGSFKATFNDARRLSGNFVSVERMSCVAKAPSPGPAGQTVSSNKDFAVDIYNSPTAPREVIGQLPPNRTAPRLAVHPHGWCQLGSLGNLNLRGGATTGWVSYDHLNNCPRPQ